MQDVKADSDTIGCVVPRPIGWISTVYPSNKSQDGKPQYGLAPYSQFQNLTFDPPYVMFAANQTDTGERKDTTRNVESTGQFCWNMATWDLRHSVNASSEPLPYGESEFERAGVTPIPSKLLGSCPMVAESPIRFECKYHTTLRLPANPPMGTVDIVVGRVIGVHIADTALNAEGLVDVKKIQPIARLGYYEYTVVRETFEMISPGNPRLLRGLEGSALGNVKTFEENQKQAAQNQSSKGLAKL